MQLFLCCVVLCCVACDWLCMCVTRVNECLRASMTISRNPVIHLVSSTDASALWIEQEIIGNGGECSGVFVRVDMQLDASCLRCWYSFGLCDKSNGDQSFEINIWNRLTPIMAVFFIQKRRNCIIASAVQKSKLIFVCVFLSHVPYWYYIFGLCV